MSFFFWEGGVILYAGHITNICTCAILFFVHNFEIDKYTK